MVEVILTVLVWRKNGRRNVYTIQNKKSEECDHEFHTTQMSVQMRPLTRTLSVTVHSKQKSVTFKQGFIHLRT
jgi:hypothetical protein